MQRRSFIAMSAAALGINTGLFPATRPNLVYAQDNPPLVVDLNGSSASIHFDANADTVLVRQLTAWIIQSAGAVSRFYGRFPVPEVRIEIAVREGGDRIGGRALPHSVPRLQLTVPASASSRLLMEEDWVLVHEMTHLAFPYIANRRHNWLVEGLAVYVEPVARIMAGQMKPQQMWSDFVTMMPRGLPGPADRGYDMTGGWARTYWGGAIFCLVCDIRIRIKTGNRHGLRDALRAINDGMNFGMEAAFADALSTGDRATGTTVLMDAWKEMREDPYDPDLPALWQDLGIRPAGSSVHFDNDAPLASIRNAITTA